MRDRAKTIEALRQLAERPGTPDEGETAKRLLEKLGAIVWVPFPFVHYPKGTRIFYCYWCYHNDPGVIVSDKLKYERGIPWMRIKFDRLKNPRWVPVMSNVGFHLGLTPFTGDIAETLYHKDVDWKISRDEFIAKMEKLGFNIRKKWYEQDDDDTKLLG